MISLERTGKQVRTFSPHRVGMSAKTSVLGLEVGRRLLSRVREPAVSAIFLRPSSVVAALAKDFRVPTTVSHS